jgi:hypothetical protein
VGEKARVIFRKVTEDKDGTKVTEEREVECDESDLADVLGKPWREPAAVLVPGAAERTAEVVRLIERIGCVVTEEHRDGQRRWTLGFTIGDGEPTPVADVAASDGGVSLNGALQAQLGADPQTGRPTVLSQGRNVVLVHQNAVSLFNQDNVYAILDLTVNVDIRP